MFLGVEARLWVGSALAAVLAGVATAMLVPACKRIARSLRALDPPGPRKTQSVAVPRLGGLAIFGGILVGGLIGLGVYPSHEGSSTGSMGLAVFCLATLLVFLVGFADDLFDISFQTKFLAQFIAASAVVYSGWSFNHLRVPVLGDVELYWVGPLVSIVWIVGVTNAINLVDGLDGLAAGIVAIISASFLIQAVINGNPLAVILMAAVTGACIGFLFFNWHPGTIFMGDAGALTLGFILASMSAQASLKTNAAVAIIVPLLALGLPVMDTFLVMAVRVLQNPHSSIPDRVASMFKADRRHLHHLLLTLIPSRRGIVIAIYGLTLLFCLSAVVVTWLADATWGVVLILVEFLAIVTIRSLGLQADTKALAFEQRQATRDELLETIRAEDQAVGDTPPARKGMAPPVLNETASFPREAGHQLNGTGNSQNGGGAIHYPGTPVEARKPTPTTPPQCIFTIDVEDWFHILDINSGPQLATWGTLPSTVERNFRHLLDLADERGVRATCFFLGWIAERFPALAREACERGHEVASHGYSHELVYQIGPGPFLEDARKSRLLLEDIIGRPVRGYRAAGFSVTEQTPWFLDKLCEAGYTYSSSVFPAARGHGGLPSACYSPHTVDCASGRMIELPISVKRVLGKPICFFGGGFLRLFPWPVIRRMTEAVLADGRPVIFYIHPREIDPEQPRLGMSPVRRFKTYVNLHSTEQKLRRIMDTFQPTSFERYLATLDVHRSESPRPDQAALSR